MFNPGDIVRHINPASVWFGSEGEVLNCVRSNSLRIKILKPSDGISLNW